MGEQRESKVQVLHPLLSDSYSVTAQPKGKRNVKVLTV